MMSELRLSIALSDYVHTRDIADGRIRPIGIDLIVNNLSFEQAAFRFGANLEFDISEYSLASLAALHAVLGADQTRSRDARVARHFGERRMPTCVRPAQRHLPRIGERHLKLAGRR
jgi:hypothetical protein